MRDIVPSSESARYSWGNKPNPPKTINCVTQDCTESGTLHSSGCQGVPSTVTGRHMVAGPVSLL